MSGASITESFKARLETLIGDRGPKTKNAVLWSEIDKIYAEARRQAAGAATLPSNINQIITDAIGTSVTDAVNSSLASVNQAIADMETDVAEINQDIGDIETVTAQLSQSAAALSEYVDATFLSIGQDISDLQGGLQAADAKLLSVEYAAVHDGVISDQYLAVSGSSGWDTGGTAPASVVTIVPNLAYPLGNSYRFTLGATDNRWLRTLTNRAIWTGQRTATAYVMEIEFDLESGGLGGAGARFLWYNSAGSNWAAVQPLTGMISNPQPSGRMLARGVFRRPDGFTGTFSYITVVLDANFSSDTHYGAREAKTLAIHRLSIRVATAEEIGSGVVGAQIAASIAAQDLVVVGREQAIAQSVTDLNAAMNTALGQKANASAVTTLTTRVSDAEGTISTMAGQISALSSDLSGLEQLTTANADAVTGIATRVDSVEGSISALSTQQTTLSASVTGLQASVQGYQVALDQVSDVTVGSAVTVTLGAGAVGLPNTVQVAEGAVARNTSGLTNGASVKIPAAVAVLLGGQRIKISVLALRPSSNAATRFGVAYSTNGDGGSGYLAAGEDTSATPKWFSFYYTVPMPSAQRDHYIGLFGDDAKSGKATRFARVSVEIAAVAGEIPAIQALDASVSDILAVKVDDLAGTALGTLLTQLDVQADGTSATVAAQGTALADLEGNAAASYVLRVGAGGAAAGLELVAADNPVSGPKSALRVDADNILLDGTVTSKKLIVTDTTNLVANPDFLFGGASWYRKLGDVTFLTGENDAPVPTVAQLVSTNAETSITTHGNFNSADEGKDGIPINAGDRFHVEAWVKSSAAGAYWPVHLVQRSAVTGALAAREPDGAAPSLAAGVWTKVTGTITVTTSGTAFLRLWNNLNNSTLKVTKLRLVKQSGGELLVDGAITAREIRVGEITADLVNAGSFYSAGLAVFAGTLQSENFNDAAGTGWILQQDGTLRVPNANIGTLKIAGQAVIQPFGAVIVDSSSIELVSSTTITGLAPGETCDVMITTTAIGDGGTFGVYVGTSISSMTLISNDNEGLTVSSRVSAGNGPFYVKLAATSGPGYGPRRLSIQAMGIKR